MAHKKSRRPIEVPRNSVNGPQMIVFSARSPWFVRLPLIYIWTAALAVVLNFATGWHYDGDLGWWLTALYAAPVLGPASYVLQFFDDTGAAIVSFGFLILLTIGLEIAVRRWETAKPTRFDDGW